MWKQEKMHFSQNSIHFLKWLCVSNKEKKSDGKNLTRTQHLPDIGCGMLPTTVLTLIKSDDFYSKIEFQDMCVWKHT